MVWVFGRNYSFGVEIKLIHDTSNGNVGMQPFFLLPINPNNHHHSMQYFAKKMGQHVDRSFGNAASSGAC